jgi:hypothetical protein
MRKGGISLAFCAVFACVRAVMPLLMQFLDE